MNNPPQPTAQFLAFMRSGGSSIAIPNTERRLIKRDGTQVPFDLGRIVRAISLAFYEVRTGQTKNPHRDDPVLRYGISEDDFTKATDISSNVSRMLDVYYSKGQLPTIEQIQNSVELGIAAAGEFEVARAYIVYRARQAERRLKAYDNHGGLRQYIAVTKYARYDARKRRRETFDEAAVRVRDMHLTFLQDRLSRTAPTAFDDKVTDLAGDHLKLLEDAVAGKSLDQMIRDAFEAVRAQRVLPSMRSLQFGGEATLQKHARMFNCAFTNIDRVEVFREVLYLLLCGCGVGFSIQKHHVGMLPPLPTRPADEDLTPEFHQVEDTIEGWADALHALIDAYYQGKLVEFEFSRIRPKGAPLVTSGGRAPGYLPLKKALTQIEAILRGASGRRLRPIEVYDIVMFAARAVLSGGIRRSATIALFSPDDEEMMSAKTGDWMKTNPQRSASNNSAVLSRSADNRELFMKLFDAQKQFGEPGFYFCDDEDFGANPCVEIGLNPTLKPRQLTSADIAKLYRYGYQGDLPGTTRLSGIQMCNLTTVNGAVAVDELAFALAVIHASIIGTCQANFTNMPYLGAVTRVINEKDALLGVSICGVMDNPAVLCDPEVLARVARLARATNRVVADLIGINHAARVTCIKPEGTASLLLGTADGIHPHHAPYYFRRVKANRGEPVYQHFRASNAQMTEVSVYSPQHDDVITFPVTAPRNAMFRRDLTAITFLQVVRLVQQAWVINGRDEDSRDPTLNHNVSNTCTFELKESDEVAQFIWANRDYFTGVSLLQASGDKIYPQAPREEVATEDDIRRWNVLNPVPVDYTTLLEGSDETALKEVVACAGGACAIS